MRKLLIILGVPVDNLTMEEALANCDTFVAAGRATGHTHQIATVNADFVVNSLHDPELRRILQEADMATADGMPLVWGSRLLGGRLPGRVTGADLVPALAQRAAEKGYSIFFLGARPGVAAQAAAILQERYPGLNVAGVFSPLPSAVLEMDRSAVEAVQQAQPDILLVAFGNPKQEKWIHMYAQELHVPIAIGIGGTLDMIVGVTKRAPGWMQRTGLEWIYRLVQEPQRLVKRYLHDLGYFGYFFVRQWWAMRRGTAMTIVPAPALPIVPIAPFAPESPSLTLPTDETSVLEIWGRLDVSNQAAFAAQASQLLQRDPHLIIRMANTQFLDSSALGALVALANQARAAGGDVWLVEVPPQIASLLSLIRLDRFFEIHADATAAHAHRRVSVLEATPQPINNGWAVVKMPRLLDAETVPTMVECCNKLLSTTPWLVLDFSDTVFLASAGMAAMIKLDREARTQRGALRIVACSRDVLRTLQLVRLDHMLALYSDIAAATSGTGTTLSELPDLNSATVGHH